MLLAVGVACCFWFDVDCRMVLVVCLWCSLLFVVVRRSSCVVRCLLLVDYCLLFVVRYVLSVVRCSLCVVRCLLVGRCVLCYVC